MSSSYFPFGIGLAVALEHYFICLVCALLQNLARGVLGYT